MFHRTRLLRFCLLGGCLPALLCLSPALLAADSVAEAEALLRDHEFATDSASLLAYVEQQIPTAAQQKQIASLIDALGHDQYAVRQQAAAELLKLQAAASPALQAARTSTDLEIVLSAQRLWQQIDSIDSSPQHASLVRAALVVIGSREHPPAVPVLLRFLANIQAEELTELATLAVWKSVREEHAELLLAALPSAANENREGIGSPGSAPATAAIPALELAWGEQAMAHLQPLLTSDSEAIRLAAARALIDRLPRESFAALVSLLESPDRRLQLQAAWLLDQVSPGEVSPNEQATNGEPILLEREIKRWQSLANDLRVDQLRLPLGPRRLVLSRYPLVFLETFATSTPQIDKAYRQFQYETTADGSALVREGKLIMRGTLVEADQRMVITSEAVCGQQRFPRRFTVASQLGGESEEGSGGWHVGVSIGRLKFLFHPGYRQGGFRVEDVTSHDYLVSNQAMPFTPTTDTLHNLRVQVSPVPNSDKFRFDVTIINGANRTEKFSYRYECEASVCGKLDRVGLERSGRIGSPAAFDSLTIDLAGER